MPLRITVNGRRRTITAPPDTPLLWVLRDDLGLTGTKYGCGVGACGACTVHLDGEPVRSCMVPVGGVAERKVTTIEGVSGVRADALRSAWLGEDVAQCGYCQAGQIMSAVALLAAHPRPTDGEIDGAMAGNLCRCGTYQRVRRAIHRAAEGSTDA